MIEIGTVIGFDPISGWPLVLLEDGTPVAARPPKVYTVTSSSAGTPPHTHTVAVGAIAKDDEVGVIPIRGRASTEWVIAQVF